MQGDGVKLPPARLLFQRRGLERRLATILQRGANFKSALKISLGFSSPAEFRTDS